MTGLRAVVTVTAAVLLINRFTDEKFMGVIIAESISATGFLLAVGFVLRKHVAIRFDRNYAVRLMQYSLPLIVYAIGLTLLSQSDRIMINQFYGKYETGLYSLAYNFSSLMLIGVTAVLNAFQPSFYSAMNAREIGRVLSEARTTMALALAAAVALVLLGELIAAWIFPAEYSDAFDIIPIVATGCLGLVSFQIWVRVLAFHNHTGLISLVAVIAVAINIMLNFWTLAPFGYKAAAYTTLAAQYLMALLCLALLWRLKFLRSLQPTTDLLVVTAICCLAMILPMATSSPALDLALRLGVAIPVLAVLAVFTWPRLVHTALVERA